MHRTKRKKLFVNSQIQGSLLVRLCVFWVLYHAYLWHILFLLQVFRQPSTTTVAQAYRDFLRSESLLLIMAAAIFPMVFWSMLRFSHQVAGPLVQVRNRLREMAAGRPATEVKFRKGDLMTEIEQAFNAYVAYRRGHDAAASPPAGSSTDEVQLLAEAQALRELATRPDPAATEPPTVVAADRA